MFLVTWSERAFEQMQRLFDGHPERHTDFTYALRQLARVPCRTAPGPRLVSPKG